MLRPETIEPMRSLMLLPMAVRLRSMTSSRTWWCMSRKLTAARSALLCTAQCTAAPSRSLDRRKTRGSGLSPRVRRSCMRHRTSRAHPSSQSSPTTCGVGVANWSVQRHISAARGAARNSAHSAMAFHMWGIEITDSNAVMFVVIISAQRISQWRHAHLSIAWINISLIERATCASKRGASRSTGIVSRIGSIDRRLPISSVSWDSSSCSQ